MQLTLQPAGRAANLDLARALRLSFHREMPVRMLYAAGHTCHHKQQQPLQKPTQADALGNVTPPTTAITFHILEIIPRDVISMGRTETQDIMILQSIVGTITGVHIHNPSHRYLLLARVSVTSFGEDALSLLSVLYCFYDHLSRCCPMELPSFPGQQNCSNGASHMTQEFRRPQCIKLEAIELRLKTLVCN